MINSAKLFYLWIFFSHMKGVIPVKFTVLITKVMKTNRRKLILSALLPALLLLITIEGCKKAADTTTPEQTNSELNLKGSVINSNTHSGIANAEIYFEGLNTTLKTDANGMYKVSCKTLGSGVHQVRVMANGYGYGFASAVISDDAAMVNTIILNPLAEPVAVGSNGGSVVAGDPESLVPSANTSLAIPSGAFSGNINVSLTRFTGLDVPGFAPVNMLNLCTVNISPAGTVANKAMDLHFSLPFSDPAIDNLPLLRYDFGQNTWISTGIIAQVDHSTNIATAQITDFATYSLAVTGTISTSTGNSGTPVTIDLDRTLSSIDFSYLAKIQYSGNVPATISAAYLKNVASQNTRIGFNDNTIFTFNYIGSKPDSLAPVKTAGYYRWMPKVTYTTQEVPLTATIQGIVATGIIENKMYSPASGYQFVHDQGGGGK